MTLFKIASAEEINQKVTDIMDALVSYQTASGGFSYWPYVLSADPFVTAYAVDVLVSAKENGFKVDEDLINKAGLINICLAVKNQLMLTVLWKSALCALTPFTLWL